MTYTSPLSDKNQPEPMFKNVFPIETKQSYSRKFQI